MSTHLARCLEDVCSTRFSATQYRRGSGENGAYFIFPAANKDFGDIEVYLEESGHLGEYTVVVGRFTHCHFACWSNEEATAGWEAELAEEVADFLEGIFSNEIEAWGSHEGSGGTVRVGEETFWSRDKPRYRWSEK